MLGSVFLCKWTPKYGVVLSDKNKHMQTMVTETIFLPLIFTLASLLSILTCVAVYKYLQMISFCSIYSNKEWPL